MSRSHRAALYESQTSGLEVSLLDWPDHTLHTNQHVSMGILSTVSADVLQSENYPAGAKSAPPTHLSPLSA